MFARRTDWDLTTNALTQCLEELHRSAAKILDLTLSNPTQAEFQYPEALLSPLAQPSSLSYEPSPKGILAARQAVAALYASKGVALDPEQIILTASTSEAYAFLFRLLCNSGDQIMVPSPGYPLFDYLAGLNDVESVKYPLRYHDCWQLDYAAFRRAVTPKTRAVVVVHPNNPTGSCVTEAEVAEIRALCAERQIPLISDEVFAEYRYRVDPQIPPTLAQPGQPQALTFSLGGLSKWAGLPQMKLAWIAVTGPAKLAAPALSRLELIADTYLSVGTPIQLAASQWLRLEQAPSLGSAQISAQSVQQQIRARVLANRRHIEEALAAPATPTPAHADTAPADLLRADGGWSVVLRIPAIRDEEAWVLRLLQEEQVLVHPGYFFDFEQPGHLVFSLLPPSSIFQEGFRRLFSRLT